MTLVIIQCFEVRLNHVSSLVQKNKAHGIARNPADKHLRVFEHVADAPVKVGHVDGLFCRQYAKFFSGKAAVSRNVGKHFFRRLARKSAYGGTYRGPERKDGFMDGHQVNNVARFAPVGSGGCLIRRQVHGMQHVTEKLIPLRRKKTEGGVVNPFQPHLIAQAFKLSLALAGDDLPPRAFKSGAS
jgi:hypothetical protein